MGARIRASELEVFRCRDSHRVLAFDSLEIADLQVAESDLRIVRVANWPFGKHWEWIYVPIAEALLTESESIVWHPRLQAPQVSAREVSGFLHAYRASVRRHGREYAPDENVVSKLFTAMVSGNVTAGRLFRSMRHDVSLDGAAAEVYDIAVADCEIRGNAALPR